MLDMERKESLYMLDFMLATDLANIARKHLYFTLYQLKF